MGKIYKGWELIKAIADGEIKEGRKIKSYGNTTYTFNGKNFERDDYDCFLTEDYEDIRLATTEFELIEDEIDINIDSIEELNDTCYDVNIMSDDDLEFYHNKTRTTMNEILQAVKQIDKRVKKLVKE